MTSTAFSHATVNVGDVTLHYVEAGPSDGEAIVLLHGWPQSWYAWRNVIPRLAKSYRVIAPDLPGFGDSSKAATGYDTLTVCRSPRRKFSGPCRRSCRLTISKRSSRWRIAP